jgi:hypothetical protein
MPPAKSVNRQAKQKQQQEKILLGVLLVLFIALFFFLVLPKLQKKRAVAHAVTPIVATSPLASSATPGAVASFTPGGSGVPAIPLASFPGDQTHVGRLNRLASKDPFAEESTLAVGTVATPPAIAPKTVPIGTTPTGTGTGTSTGPTSTVPVVILYSTISVNGVPEVVTVGGQFPASGPLFVLKAASNLWIKFALIDGSFSNGAKTLTLRRGRKITLTNRADGSRYILRLTSVTTQAPLTTATPTTPTDTSVFVQTATAPAVTSTAPPPPTVPASG